MYEILKKKFSQNFLIDKNILNKISKLIHKKNLKIIEIGPGDGRLTDFILDLTPRDLKLIEIDKDLIPILKLKYSKNSKVKIFNKDILDYNIDEKIDLIVSNLPYNISSQILVKICLLEHLPNRLILMFQKEFACRLLDKKLNSLNSLVNCFYEIEKNFQVSRNSFRPIPKIDSTVLLFVKRESSKLHINEIDNFILFKRYLFSHKRKKLNNLLKKYHFKKEEFNLNKRVEDICLEELLKIFREVNL